MSVVKTVSLKDGQGQKTTYDIGALAQNIVYDNTSSELQSNNIQDAIDELAERGGGSTTAESVKLASSGTTASGEIRFGVDDNGNYGYIKAGADSVTPFKNPTGNLAIPQITQNGTVTGIDVEDYATASLEVAVPQPSGTKNISITANGETTENVADYASAKISVNVPDAYLNKIRKAWSGLTSFEPQYIWTDGENIYYSSGPTTHYVLDKATFTWSPKTWIGLNTLSKFNGYNIWTDGDNIYYSNAGTNKVLDKSTSTWSNKTWSGLTSFYGGYIWTDGDNIYYSFNATQYVLNKSTSKWSEKTWNGLTNFSGNYVWTDGDNIYYSNGSNQYVLDKTTSTWSAKTWNNQPSNFYGTQVWTDGDNIYFNSGHVLDKATSTWSPKTWNNKPSNFYGNYVWTDGDLYYYSKDNGQYVLDKIVTGDTWYQKNLT